MSWDCGLCIVDESAQYLCDLNVWVIDNGDGRKM